MGVGAGHCHPGQKGPGVQTPTLSPISGTQCCCQPLGIAWGRRGGMEQQAGGNPSPGMERGPGLRGVAVSRSTQASWFCWFFFFPQSLAPLLGAKPADTDGVLQNRAKRQERKEQSYL